MPQISVPLYSLTSRCPLLSVKGNLEFSMRIPIPQQKRPDDTFYVVQPGDNLMKLAFQFYGDVRLWWVIYDANADQILGHPLDDMSGSYTPGFLEPGNPVTRILNIPGTTVPWRVSGVINNAYNPGGTGSGTNPISIPVVPGYVLRVVYQSGLAGIGFSFPNTDCAGWDGPGSGNIHGVAGFFVVDPIQNGCLLGSWADATGQLIEAPFAINNDSGELTAPNGATQLLMGMNDGDSWSDNNGSWVVAVTTTGLVITKPISKNSLTLRIPSRQTVEAELLDGPNV